MTYFKLDKIFRTTMLIIALLVPNITKAQKVVAAVDSNLVEFGNPVKLQISAFVKSGQKVIFPSFQNNQIVRDLEIISEPKPDTIVEQGNVTFTHTYFITSYKDTAIVIPQFGIKIDKDTLYTDSLIVKFSITPLLASMDSSFLSEIDTTKELQIFDIREVKDAPWTWEEFWARFGHIILIILIVAIITAIATYCYIRWKNNKPIIPISRPKEPADKTAFKELDKLKEKRLWQSGKTKEYYSRLIEILKTYISDRYETSVMESTSKETFVVLSKFMERNSESYQAMASIFDLADLAKYAKLEPGPDDNENSMKFAVKFVELTKKLEVENPENQDKTVKISNNKEEK